MSDYVLINAPGGIYSPSYNVDPKIPLGLLYVAASLRQHDISARILDYCREPYNRALFAVALGQEQPRVVGLNLSTANRSSVYSIVADVKSIRPDTFVIVGGPHASVLPNDVLEECQGIDGVVVGEGEEVAVRVFNELPPPRSFPGFCARADQGRAGHTPRRVVDLDQLPLPAYDLIDTAAYLSVSPELYIASSRGCYYDCVFCCSRLVFGRPVAFRTARSVLNEIATFHSVYGVSSYYFYDDNILAWPQLEEFCTEIACMRQSWSAQANINDVNAVTARAVAAARCSRLSFGFESGSRDVQHYIGKVIHSDAMKRVADLVSKGVACRGFFVVGFPIENIDSISTTARYMIELRNAGLSDVAVFPARPYPGTRLWTDCLRLFGKGSAEGLLRYRFVDDFRTTACPEAAMRLRRYNTIPEFQINLHFSQAQVRLFITRLYELFYTYPAGTVPSVLEVSELLSSSECDQNSPKKRGGV